MVKTGYETKTFTIIFWQRPTIDLSYNGDNTACIEAFAAFKKFVEDGTISQGMLNSYISACQMESTTHSQTCHYTDMLAFTLRKQGYPVDGDDKCCKFNVLLVFNP